MAAMTGSRVRLVLPVLTLSVVACGPAHGGVVSGTPLPIVSLSPSPSAAPAPLIAVLDHPFGATPNTLRLMRPDGAQVAAAALDPDAEAIAVAGSSVVVAGAGRMETISADGVVAPLPTLPGSATADIVRGLVADPTGDHLLWASVAQGASGVDSRLYLAAASGAASPVRVAERRSQGTALQPVAWTAGGPVVSEEPLGIGGYVLFRHTFGAASLLDLASGALRALGSADCAFSDLRADGTEACVVDGREGPHGSGPVTLRILRPGAAPVSVALPSSVQQAGAAYFRPDGAVVCLGTSPALGEGQEQIELDLVDVATGTRHTFGPTGLMPQGWLPDGRLVAVRLPGVGGGDVGTYVVNGDGTAALVSTASTVIGLVR